MSEINAEGMFTPQVEPEQGMDFKAWLSGARPPARTVQVYGRADLLADLDALDIELRAARESAQAGTLAGSPTRDVERRIQQARDELRASALSIRLRALTTDEMTQCEAAAAKAPDGETDSDDYLHRMVAASAIDPRLTVEDAAALHAAIGDGQFLALNDAIIQMAHMRQVRIPFSSTASAGTQPT